MSHLRVGVVGAGRVGAVLAAALRRSTDQRPGEEIVAVSGESEASRQRIADLLPDVPVRVPGAVARGCDLLLLTVPDDVLGGLVATLAASGALREGQVVAHTSGRHGLGILAPATAVGAHGIALHPAMTFSGTTADLDRLALDPGAGPGAGCVFGLTAAPRDRTYAESLVAALGGRPLWVPEEMRTLYHAGLAHGANHLVTLVGEAMEILRAAGATDPAGTLRPLLGAALDNALDRGDAALTGPIVRGDAGTIAAHLEDLAANAPQTLPSYLAMARATLERVVTDGRLSEPGAGAIAALLSADRVPEGVR